MNKIALRVIVLFLIAGVFLVGALLWWLEAIAPANPRDTTDQLFSVSQNESVRTIATRLKNAGLIKNQIGFFLEVKLLKLDGTLQAGEFHLNPAMNTRTIIDQLQHGTHDVQVVLIEGLRDEEIAGILTKVLSIPHSEFMKYAHEGYMFPDTYDFIQNASASAVVDKLTQNFNRRVDDQIQNGIKSQGLSLNDGIILASVVEREGVNDSDRPIIAGILLKRLKNSWPLQTDATLQYALGYQETERSWWKKALSTADKEIDSPYNTYIHVGLPPGPICNPGLSSIRAVAFPQTTDYWYYLHDTRGVAHYSKTLEEHNQNIQKYL